MDPLSFTASLVAVIGAANSTAKGIEKLLSLRHAQTEVLQLLDEIEDLKLVLLVLKDVEDNVHGNTANELREQFQALVKRADTTMSKLQKLIYPKLVLTSPSNGSEKQKISHRWWLRKRSELMQVKTSLRDIKSCIDSILMVQNLKQTQGVPMVVDQVAALSWSTTSQTKETSEAPLQIAADETLEHQLSDIAGTETYEKHLTATGENSINTSSIHGDRPENTQMFSIKTHRIIAREDCHIACRCQCHIRTKLQTPGWLKAVFGQMFYSYIGTPLLGRRSCNLFSCKQQAPEAQIHYRFPAWIAERAMFCQSLCGDLHGIRGSWSLRVPHVVPWSNNLATLLILADNNLLLQEQLNNGLATIFDVDEDGQSLLEFAIAHHSECTPLLLRSGAAWDLETLEGTTVAYKGWERYITSKQGQSDVALFWDSLHQQSKLDDLDFTGLHSIVTELSNVELGGYLILHPEEILEKDVYGRNPIMWAALNGNSKAFVELLNHVDKRTLFEDCDREMQNIFHLAARSGNVEIVEALLALDPPIDSQDDTGMTALMIAICGGHMGVVTLLLRWGASLEVKDMSGSTPFHCAALLGQTLILSRMIEHSINSKTYDLEKRTAIASAIIWGGGAYFRNSIPRAVLCSEEPSLKAAERNLDSIERGSVEMVLNFCLEPGPVTLEQRQNFELGQSFGFHSLLNVDANRKYRNAPEFKNTRNAFLAHDIRKAVLYNPVSCVEHE